MHSPLPFAAIVQLITLIICASASPLVSAREGSKCSARDIAIMRRTVNDETYFCKWWLADDRTRTPFLEFSPAKVTELCKCIVPVSTKKTVAKHKRAESTSSSSLEKRQTVASCKAEMSHQFTQPWKFCTFYNAYPRTTSPFARYSAKDLVKLCKCVEGKVVSTTTSKTSTKKSSASTAKLSTKSSSKTSSSKSSTKLSSPSTKSVTPKTSPQSVTKTSIKTSSSPSKTSSKSSSKSSSKVPSSSSKVVIKSSSKSSSEVSSKTLSKIPTTTSLSTSSRISTVSAAFSSKSSSSSSSSIRRSSLVSSSSGLVSSTSVPSPRLSSATGPSTTRLTRSSVSVTFSVSLPSISISSSSTGKALSSISETASSSVEATSSTESSASTTTTSSTLSAAPFSTGVLMAKGGIVDGEYWNTERYLMYPAFSSSLANRASCSIGDDRVLICNDISVNILGPDHLAKLDAEYGDMVEAFTLRCDRASDGLLTCDPIIFQGITSRGPFSTCDMDYGATLNYLEDSAQTLQGCNRIDGLYLVSPETLSPSSTTSSLSESPTPVMTTSSSASSVASIQTGLLMAKGGAVDGQYWNYGIDAQYPAFSSSLTDRVSCSLTSRGFLKCNNIPVNVFGIGLFAQLVPGSAIGPWTLRCDRAPDGLLTCGSINWNAILSSGPFAICPSPYGNTLHYYEGAELQGCTVLDGLYLDPPSEAPSATTTTSSLTESPTSTATTSSSTSSTISVPTGRIYAKGGNVDGMYWSAESSLLGPIFSSSLEKSVRCWRNNARGLDCNDGGMGHSMFILASGSLASFERSSTEIGSKLRCDRADDGLLTCDPVQVGITPARKPWAACDLGAGITLHYVENTVMPAGCTLIDGLYMT